MKKGEFGSSLNYAKDEGLDAGANTEAMAMGMGYVSSAFSEIIKDDVSDLRLFPESAPTIVWLPAKEFRAKPDGRGSSERDARAVPQRRERRNM